MGVYSGDKLNIQANAPSPLLLQSSIQKGEGEGMFFEDLWYLQSMFSLHTEVQQYSTLNAAMWLEYVTE